MQQNHSESKRNIIAFWHEYDENGYLSNWYESSFEFCGREFRTSEHWMMWQKARMFRSFENADEILEATTPKEAKALGREVSPFDSKKWDAASSQLVICGLRQKFAQDKTLRSDLLSTGSTVLVEASPYDKVWGIGLKPDDPRTGDAREWQGKNLLGRALMTVRSDLRTLDRLGCEDWREMELEGLQVWNMTLLELARNPVTRSAALAYAWSISASAPEYASDARAALRWVGDNAVGRIEDMMNTNMGGGLPMAGWRELLDDLRFQAALGRL